MAARETSAAPRPGWFAGFAWLVILAILGAALYAAGFHAGYYADDFLFVHLDRAPRVLSHFLHSGAGTHWYRPIEAGILDQIQARFGLETWPIHALALAGHVALAWLVWAGMASLGFGPVAARGGSLLMLVSQAAVSAVAGNDTLSQVMCTLFGTLSLYAAHRACAAERARDDDARVRYWLLCPLALVIALFSKEAGVAWVPALLAVIVLERWVRRPATSRSPARVVVTELIPILVAAGGYLFARQAASGVQPDLDAGGYYGFHLGANVGVNLAMLVSTPLLVLSSVRVFDAVHAHDIPTLTGIVVGTLAMAAVVLYGWRRSERRGTLAALALLGLASIAPMVALNHVSELYVYNALPFVAAILGAGAATAIRVAPFPLRVVCWVVVAAFVGGQAVSARSKTELMADNGRAAAALMPEAIAQVRALPPGGTLWLVRDADARRGYSVFRMIGVDVLRYGEDYMRERAGRPDARVEFVDEPKLGGWSAAGGHLVPVRPR